MKSVNLIPAARRDAKRRRRQRALAVAACSGYGALLLLAVGIAHALSTANGENVDARLKAVNLQIEHLDVTAREVQAELTSARATIEANRTVAEQPDWSILFRLLGQARGEDVVLRSVSIAPAPTPPGQPAPKNPELSLELLGVGRSQLSVSQHVLRLEQTSMFSRVSLLDTNREHFMYTDCIAFRLLCNFGDAPQHAQAVTSAIAGDSGGAGR